MIHRNITLQDEEGFTYLAGHIDKYGLITVQHSKGEYKIFSDMKNGDKLTINQLIGFLKDREIIVKMGVGY